MNEIAINEKLSYIESNENPLSAEIGIIRERSVTWLYDVGDGEENISGLNENYHIVLSHFHQDHIGNIDKLKTENLYVSKETYQNIHKGIIVDTDLYIGNLHIFPLPSSHCDGCLGLEVDHAYAFVGDALYTKAKGDYYVYNVALLKDEIRILKELDAPYLLVSHYDGLIRDKETVIAELETIYKMRDPNNTEIRIKKNLPNM
ncbi:MAG: MBL fold metallo-hydrolase [Clostridiales bacterium]|nr:MBL fold metallo-hydrolase [Clostridiales bacterium]